MIVFVDTNILLDVTQKRPGNYEAAASVWALIESGAVEGYISAISFNNLFYIARKKDGTRTALEAVKRLHRVFRVVALEESIIDQAIASTTDDFEDAIQATSAKQVNADYIISRDQKRFRCSGGASG